MAIRTSESVLREQCRARREAAPTRLFAQCGRVAVFDNDLALQHVALGKFGKDADIGFRVVVLYPQMIIFPGGVQVPLPVGHSYAHDPPPLLDKKLLEMEVVSGPCADE